VHPQWLLILTITENLINGHIVVAVVARFHDIHEKSFISIRLTRESRGVKRLPWALVASL